MLCSKPLSSQLPEFDGPFFPDNSQFTGKSDGLSGFQAVGWDIAAAISGACGAIP
jgi:hypothetical protein